MTLQQEYQAWLEFRKTGIGASEVSTVLGANPYCSRMQLYADKIGKFTVHETEEMYFGKRLESFIAEEYILREEAKGNLVSVEDPGRFASIRHPKHSWLFATADRIILQPGKPGKGALECKNTGFDQDEWDECGPEMHLIQNQVQMEVLGLTWGVLAGFIRGCKFVSHYQDKDEDFCELMLEEVEAFWKLVQSKTPPDPEPSKSCLKALRALHPLDSGETIDLGPQGNVWGKRYDEILKEKKLLEDEKMGIQASVQVALKENTYGSIPHGGRFSWKRAKDGNRKFRRLKTSG